MGGFVGSEGLFGVALEITLRLLPRPGCYRTVLAAYRSLEAAGDAVSRIVASGLLPGAMEIMDRLAIRGRGSCRACRLPARGRGHPHRRARRRAARSRRRSSTPWPRLIDASGAYVTRVAQTAAERAAIWKGRKSAFSAVGRLSPDFIVQDGVVPRSRLGEALARIQELSREHGLRVANVFHAGDGNLHPLILFDGREPGALERAETLAGDILRLCIALGGSITGEHGVGLEKREYLDEMYGPEDMACMKRLRAAIDPRGIANRGKMFADGEAPALTTHGLHPLERAGVISRE